MRIKLPGPFKGLTHEELKLLLVLGPGSFVSASTIGTINIGLPAIQREFDISLSALKWVSIMGGIMIASLSLCFGRLGDIVGRKRIYKAGIIVYCVTSGLAAIAVSFPILIAVRVPMAMGIAMSMPLTGAIVASAVRPEVRGQAIGLIASFSAAGQLAVPSLGGFGLDLFGWRGVFLANMVVAGIVAITQHFILKGDDERRHEAFDLGGSVLLLIGYPSLLIAISLGPRTGWDTSLTLLFFGIAIVGLAAFAYRETHFQAPLFRFRFFRSLPFCIAMFTLIIASFVQSPITLFTPLYLRNVLIISPATVGLLLMALPISTLVAGPVGGRLADKYNARVIAAAGVFITFLAVLTYSLMGVNSPMLLILIPLVLVGVGGGFFRPANQVAVYATVNRSDYGGLSAMLSSLGSLAGTMGATIMVAITETRSASTDPVTFTSGQQFTFTLLLPLLLLSVFVSLLGRSKAKEDLPTGAVSAATVPAEAGSPAVRS
jgi:MFS family permease